jgi:hypothetical protein
MGVELGLAPLMMGHRASLNGSEVDTLTRSRRWYHFKPGTRPWCKRQFNKRMRRAAKLATHADARRRETWWHV